MGSKIKIALAGLAAGAVNGLFGAGGGMIMVSALGRGIPCLRKHYSAGLSGQLNGCRHIKPSLA